MTTIFQSPCGIGLRRGGSPKSEVSGYQFLRGLVNGYGDDSLIAEEDGDDIAENEDSDDSQTEGPETGTEEPDTESKGEGSGDMEGEGIGA